MTIWFSSDLHLFHDNMFKSFRIPCPDCKGTGLGDMLDVHTVPCPLCFGKGEIPARPFSTVAEMHDTMIEAHNSRVATSDHWWNLGDVCMRRSSADKQATVNEVKKFNGHGRLVLGNHDHYPMDVYKAMGFDKIKGSHRIDNLLFSHFPLHAGCIPHGCVNIHGHIHTNPAPSGPYINICVEATGYAPLSLEELKTQAQKLLETKDV